MSGVEANGTTFVMRGVSHPYAWFTSQNSSFANIKSFGANTVRVVLGSALDTGGRAQLLFSRCSLVAKLITMKLRELAVPEARLEPNLRHWYISGPVEPPAVTVNVAVWPMPTHWLTGWLMMKGSTTVRLATRLVSLPESLVTITE